MPSCSSWTQNVTPTRSHIIPRQRRPWAGETAKGCLFNMFPMKRILQSGMLILCAGCVFLSQEGLLYVKDLLVLSQPTVSGDIDVSWIPTEGVPAVQENEDLIISSNDLQLQIRPVTWIRGGISLTYEMSKNARFTE